MLGYTGKQVGLTLKKNSFITGPYIWILCRRRGVRVGAGAIYCCMILAKIFLGFRAISSLHFWHPHFLSQLVLTAYSGTLTQPV